MKGKDDSGIGQPVDVICQHCRDGTIIPMRVRLKDEEGMLQSYSIKGYRKVDGGGFSMPDGVYISMMILAYECKITSFDRERMIRLYYRSPFKGWIMTV